MTRSKKELIEYLKNRRKVKIHPDIDRLRLGIIKEAIRNLRESKKDER